MGPQKNEDAAVIDLVSYKIQKAIQELPLESVERKMNESILGLYEEGVVRVTWNGDDMWVAMADGSNISPDILGMDLEGDEELEVVYHDDGEYFEGLEVEFTPDFSPEDCSDIDTPKGTED